jgi:hypothetical protein
MMRGMVLGVMHGTMMVDMSRSRLRSCTHG